MSSVTSKALRKKGSNHGTIINRLVNKIESYSTKEPHQIDAAQLDDFLSSLKNSPKIISKFIVLSLTPSRQQNKKTFLFNKNLLFTRLCLNSVFSDRYVKHIV